MNSAIEQSCRSGEYRALYNIRRLQHREKSQSLQLPQHCSLHEQRMNGTDYCTWLLRCDGKLAKEIEIRHPHLMMSATWHIWKKKNQQRSAVTRPTSREHTRFAVTKLSLSNFYFGSISVHLSNVFVLKKYRHCFSPFTHKILQLIPSYLHLHPKYL